MTKEVRCILFDQNEVRVGVIQYLKRRGRKINGSLVGRIEFVNGKSGIEGYLHYQAAAGLHPVALDVSDMLTAMLMLCGTLRVPLPRRASKALMLHRHTLVLSITDDKFVQNVPAVANNEISYVDGAAQTIVRKVLNTVPEVAMQG